MDYVLLSALGESDFDEAVGPGAEAAAFGVFKLMAAVFLGDALQEVDFAVVGSILNGVDTGLVNGAGAGTYTHGPMPS